MAGKATNDTAAREAVTKNGGHGGPPNDPPERAPAPKGPESHDDMTKSLTPEEVPNGILIPLKTTLEEADTHQMTTVMITRAPVKLTSNVIRCAFAQTLTIFDNDPSNRDFLRGCQELVEIVPSGPFLYITSSCRRAWSTGGVLSSELRVPST
jgi:hypothetical protein